jgi:hypothetical protein
MIEWVRQEETNGCGVAVLAMILGKSYAEARQLFEGAVDFEKKGISHCCLDGLLADLGYAVARKYLWRGFRFADHPDHEKDRRSPWPPEPFADLHICQVEVYERSPLAHFVLLLRDGRVLDPLTPEEKRLSDYHRVMNVGGLARIGSLEKSE